MLFIWPRVDRSYTSQTHHVPNPIPDLPSLPRSAPGKASLLSRWKPLLLAETLEVPWHLSLSHFSCNPSGNPIDSCFQNKPRIWPLPTPSTANSLALATRVSHLVTVTAPPHSPCFFLAPPQSNLSTRGRVALLCVRIACLLCCKYPGLLAISQWC